MIQAIVRLTRGLPALIMLALTLWQGRTFIYVLQRQHPWSTFMLLFIACLAAARVLRDVRELRGDRTDRSLVTRNATIVVAALLGCIAAGSQAKWANGSAIVSLAFVFVLEYLRQRASPVAEREA